MFIIDKIKNWNKTGKIKAIIIGLCALPNLLAPVTIPQDYPIVMAVLMPMFFAIAIPFMTKVGVAIFGQQIIKPNWNDSPLTLSRPLTFYQFVAYLFLTVGLSLLIGTAVHFKKFSSIGLMCASFGLAILIGITLTLRWTKTTEK